MSIINSKFFSLIINLNSFLKQLTVFFLDILIAAFSISISFLLLYNFDIDQINKKDLIYFFIMSLSYIPIFIYFGLYKSIFRYFNIKSIFIIFISVFLYFFIFFNIFLFFDFSKKHYLVILIQPIIFLLVVLFSRLTIVMLFEKIKTIDSKSKILIYGAGDTGSFALNYLKNLKILGFIDDNEQKDNRTISGYKIYHSSKINKLLTENTVSQIIITISDLDYSKRREIISRFRDFNIEILFFPSVIEIVEKKINLKNFERVNVTDILNRKINMNIEKIHNFINNKKILITGAGGSIGSEIVQQCIRYSPKDLIFIENNEFNLYKLKNAIDDISVKKKLNTKFKYLLCSIDNNNLIGEIFKLHKPQIVFHAAAYKHVPLAEENVIQYIQNNVFGTLNILNHSIDNNVENFLFVSTDKAVRPNNIMGASKRIAELTLLSHARSKNIKSIISIIRFGNVLNSIGSVLPLFEEQLTKSNFLTVTHPDVTRYFMSINEAVGLVLNALTISKGGEVFLLNMGEPVKILDLAKKLIKLHGYREKTNENEDGIEIRFTGLRPGEKLYEELLIGNNPIKTENDDIFMEKDDSLEKLNVEKILENLNDAIKNNNIVSIKEILKNNIDGYRG